MKKAANLVSALATILTVLVACSGQDNETSRIRAAAGDPKLGAAAILRFGCGSCHAIPGIPGASGIVGPPLSRMARRAYLAGVLTNTPENMIRWLLNPPEVDPSTAMPNVGLTESDARHIAAYLYTLQ